MAKRKNPTLTPKQLQQKVARENIKKLAAELKRKGLIYQDKDLRGAKVTRYMREQVKKYAPVLTGEAEVIKGPRERVKGVRDTDGVIGYGRDFLVVKAEPNTVQTIRKGLRSRVIPLGGGKTIEMLSLPYKLNTPSGRERFFRDLESGALDALKNDREYFAFRMNGAASVQALPNVRSLRDYIEQRYAEALNDPAIELVLYRVYPPDAWEKLYREEFKAKEPQRSKAQRERERVRKQMQRRRLALSRPDPEALARQAEARLAAYKEREKARLAALEKERPKRDRSGYMKARRNSQKKRT